jgi:hypothetical protein
MADRKISDLTALTTPASGDFLPIVDISEAAAASKNKRITIEELFRGVPLGTAAAPSIAIEGNENTGVYSPGVNQLALSTAGNGRLFIDGTGLVGIGTVPAAGCGLNVRGITRISSVGSASGLEVGIGTATNQSAYLDLIGDATYTDYGLRVLRGSTGANADSSIRHKGTGVLTLITEEAGSITLATNNTGRARVDPSGRLLVGPTASSIPTAGSNGGLQLHNVTNDNGALLSIVRFNTDTGGPVLVLGKSKSATVAAGAVVANNDSLGTISFVGDDGADLASLGASISCSVDGTPGANDMPGRLVFATTADGVATPTERMRITSAGLVGIGTTSPTTLLDVNADTVRVRTARTPASASATGATGEICWDANYIYVAVGTNTWKRAALSTW